MRDRSRKQKTLTQIAQIAHSMVDAIAAGDSPLTTPDGKNAFAAALGRRGGLKGGPARAAKLTAKQLSESAKKAANARWSRARHSNGD